MTVPHGVSDDRSSSQLCSKTAISISDSLSLAGTQITDQKSKMPFVSGPVESLSETFKQQTERN